MSEPAWYVLETTASPSCLDEVHALLDRLWADVTDVQPSDRNAFQTAVAEVAANIVEHSAQGRAVAMRLRLRSTSDRVEAHLEDLGHPYEDAGQAPVPELDEHGRGLFMARALTDELLYERDGSVNRWFLLRHRR